MRTKNNQLDELQKTSINELLRYFKAKSSERIGLKDASKTAVSALSAVGRIKATERAGDATQAYIITKMSKDSNEYRRYIAVSLPHLNPVARIEAGK